MGPQEEFDVSKRNYRPVQMHRIAYTDMSEAQMTQAWGEPVKIQSARSSRRN